MSTLTHKSMTNHHVAGVWASLARDVPRLARSATVPARSCRNWTDRDLHDVGLSWSDIVHEAEKPFWRA